MEGKGIFLLLLCKYCCALPFPFTQFIKISTFSFGPLGLFHLIHWVFFFPGVLTSARKTKMQTNLIWWRVKHVAWLSLFCSWIALWKTSYLHSPHSGRQILFPEQTLLKSPALLWTESCLSCLSDTITQFSDLSQAKSCLNDGSSQYCFCLRQCKQVHDMREN